MVLDRGERHPGAVEVTSQDSNGFRMNGKDLRWGDDRLELEKEGRI